MQAIYSQLYEYSIQDAHSRQNYRSESQYIVIPSIGSCISTSSPPRRNPSRSKPDDTSDPIVSSMLAIGLISSVSFAKSWSSLAVSSGIAEGGSGSQLSSGRWRGVKISQLYSAPGGTLRVSEKEEVRLEELMLDKT
ncbi:unnamed protein product [Zymoseptoria tritici ST99CH_1E4]|uniref:Uncharacterized protein n=2 Tax=Zymoseptoria tritici TaxID=1047171 RepID=F9XS33_ZYMTI|nr:uncharacterized protein MYCGRDRAFT_98022 [Zymoseptoria tritici IPO323]EGP81949.1 hypothetical protein MYCGRDRAFT_98022 [Zymoseptoria tritici IPO323]SMR62619.1 unnamed protein product [Zymoseptoria tritici ST99CH_1E4]